MASKMPGLAEVNNAVSGQMPKGERLP